MELKEINFKIKVYESASGLSAEDTALLAAARKTTKNAYAPYSKFYVGAAALLANGNTFTGTNQENASYPVGICAERTLLSAISSQFPNEPVVAMAVSYHNMNGESSKPISPCGVCRQTLVEYQERTKTPIRIILSGMTGEVYVIENAKQLLPLSFSASDMNL